MALTFPGTARYLISYNNLGFSMNNSEKLCLQWNDFRENIHASFGELRDDTEFSDVTLACEDGKQMQAHKVILAASSPFFKDFLRKNKHQHPLLYMRGLKYEDLVAILDFLYYGEANVVQENLDSFLGLAEELKLKGLTAEGNYVDKEEEIRTQTINQDQPLKTEKQPKYKMAVSDKNVDKLDTRMIAVNKSKTSGDSEGLDAEIQSMITKSDLNTGNGQGKMATCNICGKQGPFKAMPRHVEANHISGVSHACDICGSISRSKNGLKQHTLKIHFQVNEWTAAT